MAEPQVRPKRIGNNQNYYYPNKVRTFWMSSPISNDVKGSGHPDHTPNTLTNNGVILTHNGDPLTHG